VKLPIGFIFSLLILALAISTGRAQEVYDTTKIHINTKLGGEADEEEQAQKDASADSLRNINLIRFGLQLLIDYGKIATLASEFESKYDVEAGLIVFRRANIALEYGGGTLSPKKAFQNVGFYTVEGQYVRFGLDYIFALNAKNTFAIGGRYGVSNYADEGRFLLSSPLWETYQSDFGSDDLSATWVALAATSETLMRKNLYLGIKLRLRYLLEFETREDIPVYSIPGYGRTFDKSVPAVNLYIKYRIPFSD